MPEPTIYRRQLADGGFAIFLGARRRARFAADWKSARALLEQLVAERQDGARIVEHVLAGAGSLAEPGRVLFVPGRSGFGIGRLYALPDDQGAQASDETVVLGLGPLVRYPLRLPHIETAREIARRSQLVHGHGRLPWQLVPSATRSPA